MRPGQVERYAPNTSLPSYTYVPGRSPHPVSDPRGHSFGRRPAAPVGFDADDWRSCQPYLYGIDLFNHGYYWEAHEAWEGLWHACGRSGRTGDFLKGLIQLAVAGVKVREGKPVGVRRHALRAADLFRKVNDLDRGEATCMGLVPEELIRHAGRVAGLPLAAETSAGAAPPVVFDFSLCPGRPVEPMKGRPLQ
jgi:hypothetical protein